MTALSSSQPLAPVSRAPCLVGKGDDEDHPFAFGNDHAVRKTSKKQSLDTTRPGDAEQGCKREDFLLQDIQGRIDRSFEIRPESKTLTFVLRGSFSGLLGRRHAEREFVGLGASTDVPVENMYGHA